MDDQTARYLLTALLQSTATIWGLFLLMFIFYIKDLRKESDTSINDLNTPRDWLIDFLEFLLDRTRKLEKYIIISNIFFALTIASCIFALVAFRNDYLILLTLFLFFGILIMIVLMVFSITRVDFTEAIQHFEFEISELKEEQKKKRPRE